MKRFSLLIAAFIFSVFCFAQPVTFGIFGDIPGKLDFTNPSSAIELMLNGNYFDFETDAGFKANSTALHFTTSGNYMPELVKGLKIGGGVRYHYLTYEDIFTENNWLFSARARYTTAKNFSIEASYSMLLVYTKIRSVKRTMPVLFNRNSGIEVLLSKQFNNQIKGYLNFTSYDYFDYPYLGVPFVKTGIEYKPFDKLYLVGDYTVKLQDMFTSTTYVSGSYGRIGVKVEVW